MLQCCKRQCGTVYSDDPAQGMNGKVSRASTMSADYAFDSADHLVSFVESDPASDELIRLFNLRVSQHAYDSQRQWRNTSISSVNEDDMFFIGQEDGNPSTIDLHPASESHTYFGCADVTIPMYSAKRDRAACKIQREWRQSLCDPSRLICRRRLFREFSELCTKTEVCV